MPFAHRGTRARTDFRVGEGRTVLDKPQKAWQTSAVGRKRRKRDRKATSANSATSDPQLRAAAPSDGPEAKVEPVDAKEVDGKNARVSEAKEDAPSELLANEDVDDENALEAVRANNTSHDASSELLTDGGQDDSSTARRDDADAELAPRSSANDATNDTRAEHASVELLGDENSTDDDALNERIAGEGPDETVTALAELSGVALAVIALCTLPYLIPGLRGFRAWEEGDAIPLASLLANEDALPSFAGSGGASDEVAGEGLSEAIASSLSEPETVPEGPRIRILAEEYAGIEQRIQDEGHRGLAPFFERLRETALAETGEVAMTRVSHYGDSSIATDLITSTVRRRMQRRFGDGGHGFVLIGRGYLAYRHRDVDVTPSDEWSLREIVRRHDRQGLYGYGGVQFRGRPGARTRFATVEDRPVGGAINRFEIWYQRHRRGGHIHYRVDRGPRQVIETRQEDVADDVLTIDLPTGPHELEVRFGGHGQSRLYGVVLENVGAGVVYDSLGLVGARAARLLHYDAEHIASQLARRATNLLILGFGGNEASDRIQQARYQADFEAVIERMRGGREDLGCLVFAPLDQAKRNERGRVVTLEAMSEILAAQEAAAAASGCAFFNTFEAMGGEGSMGEWLSARPRLAMSDLRHATPAGYEVIGNLFYKALLASFADWLELRQSNPATSDRASALAP